MTDNETFYDNEPESGQGQVVPAWIPNPNPIGFRHSQTIGKLVEALSVAVRKFNPIKKETENPYFKSQYADLSTLIAATRDALSESGLVVIQTPRTKDGSVFVTTALLHTSNEWIAEDLELRPAKSDPQGCGSAMTYARRYAYQSILNIAGEVDDDGNAASGKKSKDVEQAEEAFQEKTGQQRAPMALVNAFQELFKTCGKTEKQLVDILRARWSADRPDQLTKQELDELLKWAVGKEPLEETLKTSLAAAGKAVYEPLAEERPNTPPKSSQGTVGRVGVTEKQIGRLWAIAKSRGVPQEDVHVFLKEQYGYESAKDLTRAEYDEFTKFLEAQ
jgi:hypothetical protein